jgi:hypothetical protein
MLYIVGLLAALGYIHFKGNVIKSAIDAQVAEFHAQEELTQNDEAPDATYKEIRASWKHGSKTGFEDMNHVLPVKDKKILLAGQTEMEQQAHLYDSVGCKSCADEIEGVILEMAVRP